MKLERLLIVCITATLLPLPFDVHAQTAPGQRTAKAKPSATVVQQEHEEHFEIQGMTAKVRYLLFLPQGYQESRQRWPLLMFLHGASESGTNLASLKRNGPPKYVETHHDFPFILVSPQYNSGNEWHPALLLALMDNIMAHYMVDPRRVYLTGLSMGGGATWSLAAQHPERFAAIVPVSGVGEPGSARKLAGLPTWVFHGEKDSIIPVHFSRDMVAAIQAAAGTVKYTEFPRAHHNI